MKRNWKKMPRANKETKFGERSDLAHKAYMGIRQMLFYNEIISGQKIKYQDLADRLDVSITPVIHALKNTTNDDKDRMIKIIQNQDFSAEDFKTLVELLDKHGGLAYTQKTAASYIDNAKKALSLFEPSQTKDIMMDIADYALARRL